MLHEIISITNNETKKSPIYTRGFFVIGQETSKSDRKCGVNECGGHALKYVDCKVMHAKINSNVSPH